MCLGRVVGAGVMCCGVISTGPASKSASPATAYHTQSRAPEKSGGRGESVANSSGWTSGIVRPVPCGLVYKPRCIALPRRLEAV